MRDNVSQSNTGLALDPPKTTTEELVRVLVGQAAKSSVFTSHPEPKDESEEIIVDAEVDGARYLLVRLPKPTHAHVSLSPRETEIARMIAQGHSDKVVAGFLNISPWTVRTHLRRIFAKLHVGSRAAMVARLLEPRRTELRPSCQEAHSGLSPTSRTTSQYPSSQPTPPSLRIPGKLRGKAQHRIVPG